MHGVCQERHCAPESQPCLSLPERQLYAEADALALQGKQQIQRSGDDVGS